MSDANSGPAESQEPKRWMISMLADGNGVCHGCGCIIAARWGEEHQRVCPAPHPEADAYLPVTPDLSGLKGGTT